MDDETKRVTMQVDFSDREVRIAAELADRAYESLDATRTLQVELKAEGEGLEKLATELDRIAAKMEEAVQTPPSPEQQAEFNKIFPPRRVNNRVDAVDLTGALFPWLDATELCEGTPLLLELQGTNTLYLPMFTTVEKLRAELGRTNTKYDRIKQVQDGAEFLASIPPTDPDGRKLRIMLDPWYTPQGTLRWREVFGAAS